MPTKGDRRAQEVIEEQCEAHERLRLLRQHPTVAGNPQLKEGVEASLRSIERANVSACAVWFAGEREIRAA